MLTLVRHENAQELQKLLSVGCDRLTDAVAVIKTRSNASW